MTLLTQTVKTPRKVFGSVTGAGVSATFAQDLAEILTYFLQDLIGSLPEDVEAGIVRILVVIVVAASSYIAARFTRPGEAEAAQEG